MNYICGTISMASAFSVSSGLIQWVHMKIDDMVAMSPTGFGDWLQGRGSPGSFGKWEDSTLDFAGTIDWSFLKKMHRKQQRVQQLLEQITQMLRRWHVFSPLQLLGLLKEQWRITPSAALSCHMFTLYSRQVLAWVNLNTSACTAAQQKVTTESLRPQQPSKSSDLSTWTWATERRCNHPPRPLSKMCRKAPHQIRCLTNGCSREVFVLLQLLVANLSTEAWRYFLIGVLDDFIKPCKTVYWSIHAILVNAN